MSFVDLGQESARDEAHRQTRKALRVGELVRPEHCSKCGARDRKLDGASKYHTIHGHHDDYAKPLDVRWLCAECHRSFHAPEHREGTIRHRVRKRGGVYIEDFRSYLPTDADDVGFRVVDDPRYAFAHLISDFGGDGVGDYVADALDADCLPLPEPLRPGPTVEELMAERFGDPAWKARVPAEGRHARLHLHPGMPRPTTASERRAMREAARRRTDRAKEAA